MNYRDMREAERTRYLAINGAKLPDAEQRWRKYEQLILDQFGPGRTYPPLRRIQALDYAWEARDKSNYWASNKNKVSAPRSEHGNGPERSTE